VLFCGVECWDAGLLGNLESRSYSGGDHSIHDLVERCQRAPEYRVATIDSILETSEPYLWCHNGPPDVCMQGLPVFP